MDRQRKLGPGMLAALDVEFLLILGFDVLFEMKRMTDRKYINYLRSITYTSRRLEPRKS